MGDELNFEHRGVVAEFIEATAKRLDWYGTRIRCTDLNEGELVKIGRTLKEVNKISNVIGHILIRAEERRDPSDGPFLSQEPEEPDGFCDCPECCGE